MSDVKVDRDLEARLRAATDPEMVHLLISEAARRQGFVPTNEPARGADGRFVSQQQPTPQATPEPREFKQTVLIHGKPLEFTANSLEQLEAVIENAKVVADQFADTSTTAPDLDPAAAHEAELVRRADLELRLTRGEISVAEAVDQYLAQRGVDVDALAEATLRNETESWQEASEQFLAQSDWPGGQRNLALISDTIQKLGLLDSDDKVAALQQAYDHMKSRGLLFENESLQVTIDPFAQPTEILEAWKRQIESEGGDPNQTFLETHRRGRVNVSSSIFGK